MKRGLKGIFGLMLVAIFLMTGNVADAQKLIIFHTNDIHGRIKAGDADGRSIGIAQTAAIVRDFKKTDEATLWFDAGDTFHGQPVININQGLNMVPIMNFAGYDAMTPGNHDFNYGTERLKKLSELLNFPMLSANVTYKDTGKLVFEPYKIFKFKGIKVGVFGLTTPETLFKVAPKMINDININNPIEVSRDMVKKLRSKCDVLIALSHIGVEPGSEFTSDKIAREVPGIDLIVDGHSHTELPHGIKVGDTLIVQAGYHGNKLGMVTIEVEKKKIVSKEANLLYSDDLKIAVPAPDKEVLGEIENAENMSKEFFAKILTYSNFSYPSDQLKIRREDTELGNLCADAFRNYTDADIAVINGGGIRGQIPEGDVTYGDIMQIFPFGNSVDVIKIDGKTIREMLENSVKAYPAPFGGFLQVSGMTFEFDPDKPAGSRVGAIYVDNAPIDENKTYTLALSSFLTQGGDEYTMLKDCPLAGVYGSAEDAMVDYLNQYGVNPDSVAIGRIKCKKYIPFDWEQYEEEEKERLAA